MERNPIAVRLVALPVVALTSFGAVGCESALAASLELVRTAPTRGACPSEFSVDGCLVLAPFFVLESDEVVAYRLRHGRQRR